MISGICLLSLGGLEVVERLVPAQTRQQHNDVAGFIYAALGVIYAVLLALVVIAGFDLVLLAVATVLCATTFLDPQIALFFGLGDNATRVLIGVCSIVVFLMSIIVLRVDWKERSARHKQACQALSEIKARSRDLLSGPEIRREEEAPEFLRASASVMNTLEPIPDAQFNALRAQHHRKIALSKLHSRYPSAPTWLLRWKLRTRETLVAPSQTLVQKQGDPMPMAKANCSGTDVQRVATAYWVARHHISLAGYARGIDWQESLSPTKVTESQFLRESAWVILCSGMRESIVRRRFDSVSAAFLRWRSANAIVHDAERCRSRALERFGHSRKIEAILRVATFTVERGFASIKKQFPNEGPAFLEQLPFIGPVTLQHLAKNFGFPVAKPDRHLVRLAAAVGYPDVDRFCADVAKITGQPISVVDLVLWRYATLFPDYVAFFTGDEVPAPPNP